MAKFYHPPNTHRARIMRVADGDTVLVLIEGLWGTWSEKYVRLAGIESYELDGPDAAKVKAVKVELNSLLEGRNVLVHLQGNGTDRYGRLRGRITVGDSDLATLLVEKGFAWYCTKKESVAQHAVARVASNNGGSVTHEAIPVSVPA